MSIFDLFKKKKSVGPVRTTPIVLTDVNPKYDLHVFAAVLDGKLVYLNKNLPQDFLVRDSSSTPDSLCFEGRLFKSEIHLKWFKRLDLFYAVPMLKPHVFLSSMNPQKFDQYALAVITAFQKQNPDLFTLDQIIAAPSRWSYHGFCRNAGRTWFVTNNSGDDAMLIHDRTVKQTKRDELLDLYHSVS